MIQAAEKRYGKGCVEKARSELLKSPDQDLPITKPDRKSRVTAWTYGFFLATVLFTLGHASSDPDDRPFLMCAIFSATATVINVHLNGME